MFDRRIEQLGSDEKARRSAYVKPLDHDVVPGMARNRLERDFSPNKSGRIVSSCSRAKSNANPWIQKYLPRRGEKEDLCEDSALIMHITVKIRCCSALFVFLWTPVCR